MFTSDKWRRVSLIALPLALGVVATGLACRDASTSNERTSTSDTDLQRLKEERAPTAASGQLAWVGAAHNRALDDFRRDLRQPGVLTKDFCLFILDFMAREERIPRDHAKGAAEMRRNAGMAGFQEGMLCGEPRADGRQVSLQSGVSYEASTLFYKIQSSIDLATDRYDLASRLRGVTDAAQQLNESERTIIGAVAATAQSSFEYWQVELPYANREFVAEYGACADQAAAAGYDSDYARQICLGGKVLPTRTLPAVPRPQVRLASYGVRPGCSLSANFKSLGKADALGAFGGAVKGAMSGGLAGIIPGALVGAAVGSATSWASSAWDLYWCALK